METSNISIKTFDGSSVIFEEKNITPNNPLDAFKEKLKNGSTDIHIPGKWTGDVRQAGLPAYVGGSINSNFQTSDDATNTLTFTDKHIYKTKMEDVYAILVESILKYEGYQHVVNQLRDLTGYNKINIVRPVNIAARDMGDDSINWKSSAYPRFYDPALVDIVDNTHNLGILCTDSHWPISAGHVNWSYSPRKIRENRNGANELVAYGNCAGPWSWTPYDGGENHWCTFYWKCNSNHAENFLDFAYYNENNSTQLQRHKTSMGVQVDGVTLQGMDENQFPFDNVARNGESPNYFLVYCPSPHHLISLTDNYIFFEINKQIDLQSQFETNLNIYNISNNSEYYFSVSGENIVAAITNDASYCAVYDSSNNVNVYDISNNTKHTILENNSSTQIDINNANIEISDDGLTIASHQATTWDLSTNAVELLFNTLKDLSANITESGNSKTVKISINNIKVLKYNILIDSSNLYHNSQLSTPYIELVFKNTNLFGDPTSVNDLSKTLVELNVHTPNNGSVDINNPLTTLITSSNKEGITKSVSNTNSPELGDYFTHTWQILDIKFGITIESLNVGCIACSYYNDSSFNSNILIKGIEKIVDSTDIYERSGTGNLPAISVFKSKDINYSDISTNTFPTNIHSSQAIPITVRDLSSGYTKFHVSSSDEALFDPNNKEVVAFGLNTTSTSTSNFRRNYQLRPTLGFYVGDTVKIKPMPQGENQKAALGFVPLQYTKSYFERDTSNNNFINPFVPLGNLVKGPAHDYTFGFSVAANAEGNVFITGGPYYDSQGHIGGDRGIAVVYELSDGDWIPKGQQLGKESTDFTLARNEWFGYGVGMNDIGTIVAVGSNKQKVRIFEYKNVDGIIKWHGIGTIVLPTGAGRRISLSSDGYTIAITDDESGTIYIYKYSPDTNPDTNNWTEYATPSASGVRGASLSKDGKRFAYGDTLRKVRIFEYNTSLSQWEKKQEISGPASFGYSVKLNYDGTVVAIGAQNIVSVYKQDPVTANYEHKQDFSTGHTIANNMLSINAAGNVIAIGQPHNHTLMGTGKQVQVYQLIDNTWTNLQTKYSNEIELGNRLVPSGSSKSYLAEALCLNGLGTRIYIGKQNYISGDVQRGGVDVYDINLYKNVNTPTMLIEGGEIKEPSRPEEKFKFVLNDSINFKIEKNYVRITLDTGSHQDSTSTLLLASGSKDNKIRLWSIERDGTVPTDYDPQILTEHSNYVFSVAFSPDGKLLASGSWDNTINLWSIDRNGTAALLQTLSGHGNDGHGNEVYAVAFSPDGKLLASGSWDHTVKLWSIERNGTATFRDTLTWVNSDKVWTVAFSPDGKLLASGSNDGKIIFWSIDRNGNATFINKLDAHAAWVDAVAFSPDGKLLASGSGDNKVKVWSIERDGTATMIFDSLKEHTSWVATVAFSPDGKLLASGASDNKVKLWSIKRNGTTTSIQTSLIDTRNVPEFSWVREVAFSPDGKLLAAGMDRGIDGPLESEIIIWSIEGDNISENPKHTQTVTHSVYGLAFRPTEITITTIPLDNIKPPFAFEYSAYNLDFASTYKIVREGKIPEKPLFALSAASNCLAINNQSTVEIYDYSFNNWFNTYTIKDIRSNAIYDYSFNNRFNTYTMKDICSNATEIESISMEQKDNLLIKYNTYNRYINNNTIFDYGTRSDIYRRDSSSNWNKESVLEEEKVIDKLSKFGSRVILKDGLISSNSLQITINPNGSEVPIHLIEEPRIYQVGDVTLGWQGWVTSPLPIDSLIAVRVTIKDMFFDPTGGNSVHTVGQAIMGFAKSDILNTITTPYFNTSSNDSTNITLRSKLVGANIFPKRTYQYRSLTTDSLPPPLNKNVDVGDILTFEFKQVANTMNSRVIIEKGIDSYFGDWSPASELTDSTISFLVNAHKFLCDVEIINDMQYLCNDELNRILFPTLNVNEFKLFSLFTKFTIPNGGKVMIENASGERHTITIHFPTQKSFMRDEHNVKLTTMEQVKNRAEALFSPDKLMGLQRLLQHPHHATIYNTNIEMQLYESIIIGNESDDSYQNKDEFDSSTSLSNPSDNGFKSGTIVTQWQRNWPRGSTSPADTRYESERFKGGSGAAQNPGSNHGTAFHGSDNNGNVVYGLVEFPRDQDVAPYNLVIYNNDNTMTLDSTKQYAFFRSVWDSKYNGKSTSAPTNTSIEGPIATEGPWTMLPVVNSDSNCTLYQEKDTNKYIAQPNVAPRIVDMHKGTDTGSIAKCNVTVNQSGTLYYAAVLTEMVTKNNDAYIFKDNDNYINELITKGNNNIETTNIKLEEFPTSRPFQHIIGVRRTRIEMTDSSSVKLTIDYNNVKQNSGIVIFAFFVSNNLLLNSDIEDGGVYLNNIIEIAPALELISTSDFTRTKNTGEAAAAVVTKFGSVAGSGSITFERFEIEGYIKDQTYLYAAVDLSANNDNYVIEDVKDHIETKFLSAEPSSTTRDPIIELSGSVITELSGVFIKGLLDAPGGFQPSNFNIKINPFLKKHDGSGNEGLDYELHILPFFYLSGNFTYPGNITTISFISPDFSGPIITIEQEPTLNSDTKNVEIYLKVDEWTPELHIACFPTSMNMVGPSSDADAYSWIKNSAEGGVEENIPKLTDWEYLFEVQGGSGIGGAALHPDATNEIIKFDISGLYNGLEYDIFIIGRDNSGHYFKTLVDPVPPQVQLKGSHYYQYKYKNHENGTLNNIDISLNLTKNTETKVDVDLSFNTDIRTFTVDGSGELYYFYNTDPYISGVSNTNNGFSKHVSFNISSTPNSTPQQNITLSGLQVDASYNFYFYYKIKSGVADANDNDFTANSFSFYTNNFNEPSIHKDGINGDISTNSITLKDISSSENGKILFKISENQAGITSFKSDISNNINSIINYNNSVISTNGVIPDTSSNIINLNHEDTSGTSWISVNGERSYDISFTNLKDTSGGYPYYISMVPIDDFIKPQNKGGSNSLLKQIDQTPKNPLVGQDISFVIYTKDKTRPIIDISHSDPSGTYVTFDVSSNEDVRLYFDISTNSSFPEVINPLSETDFEPIGYTEISGNLDTISTFNGDHNESITVSGGKISIKTDDTQSIFIDICGNSHKKFTIFNLNLQDHPDVEGNTHTVNKSEQTYYYRYYAIDYTHNYDDSEVGTQVYSLKHGNKTEVFDSSFTTMDISAADIFVDICNNNFSEVSGNIDISTNEHCKIYIKVDSSNSYNDLTETQLINDISQSAIPIPTSDIPHDISLNLDGLIDSSAAIVFNASNNNTYHIKIYGLYPQSEGKDYYFTFMTFDGFNYSKKIKKIDFKTRDLTAPNIHATPSSEIFFDANGKLSFDVSSNENGQIIAFGVREKQYDETSVIPAAIKDFIINTFIPRGEIDKYFKQEPINTGSSLSTFDVAFDVIDVSSSNTRPDLSYNINLDMSHFGDTENTPYSIYIYAEDKANNFSTPPIHFVKRNGPTSQIAINFTVNMDNPQIITNSPALKQDISKEIRNNLLVSLPVLSYANPIVNIKQGSLIIEVIFTVNDELRVYITNTISANEWNDINSIIPGIIKDTFIEKTDSEFSQLGFQDPHVLANNMESLSIDLVTNKVRFETLTTTSPVQGTADPYLTTIYGKTYKLDDFNGFVRLLQGTHNDKLFTMNAETKVLTDLQYRELQSWRQKEIKGRTFSDNINIESRPAYFTKLFIQYGDQQVSIDLETVNIINSNYNAKLYATLSLEQEYSWSEKKSLAAIADLIFGDIKLIIKRFQNKEIRCGFEIVNASLINDRSGALENTIYTKDMQIDNLTSLRPISRRVNRKEKRFTREEFIGNKNESLIVDIPIY